MILLYKNHKISTLDATLKDKERRGVVTGEEEK
jgi:hypothetical protein